MTEPSNARARPRGLLSGYTVGLAASLLLLPGLCTVSVVGWKLAAGDSWSAGEVLVYGTLIGLGAWILIGFPLRRHAFPATANPGVYQELAARHLELQRIADSLGPPRDDEAWATLQANLDVAARAISGRSGDGLAWASASGYMTLFTVVHKAEQALVELVPEPDVVRYGLEERSSLVGSKIAETTEVVARLDHALAMLGGDEYLPERDRRRPKADPTDEDKDIARAVVRGIRTMIDDFRDSRRSGLVRARNALYTAVVFTGIVAYSGVGVALLAGAENTQVIAGATFYLVGSTVGLFRQLRQAAVADTITEEDFGLGIVRLIQIPLLSGLAAVGGVVLTAYLTALNDAADVPPLTEVFDISDNPLGLLAAAVFGFTPALLATSLQSRAEKWKQELKSSGPGEQPEG